MCSLWQLYAVRLHLSGLCVEGEEVEGEEVEVVVVEEWVLLEARSWP